MKNIFVATLAIALFAGCGKLEQDPLAGRPDPLRNGQPPNSKPDVPKPEASDAVRVDGPEVSSFMEERADKIEFTARVLKPDYEVALQVKDLDRYPGATFDAATGAFSWTPPKGFVDAGLYREIDLQLVGVATPKDPTKPSLIANRSMHLIVNRKMLIPEVKSVYSATSQFREGSNYTMKVEVRDPDGGQADSEAPTLMMLPPASTALKSMVPYMSIKSLSVDFPRRTWTFIVNVNLFGEEVTPSSANFGLTFKAVNRFNQSSATASFQSKVFTNLMDLSTSWTDTLEMTAGTEYTIPVLFFDAKNEGRLRVTAQRGPMGANLQCPTMQVGAMSCMFKWTPPDTAAGTIAFTAVDMTSTNQDSSDSRQVSASFQLKVFVKPRPAPPTPPAPAPTPQPIAQGVEQ